MSAPAKLKVLLLENSGADALIIQRDIREVATVDVAINGRMFREMLKEPWDVILCDLSLPDIGGEEAIRLAKATHPKTGVIIVTGSVTPQQADLACEAGASRFLMKESYGVPGLKKALQQVRETAKREQEIEQLRLQSIRDQRLEQLGDLSAGIVHDFNGMLAVIMMGCDQLRTRINPMDERVLDVMMSATKRGAEMTAQVLAFARGSNGTVFKVIHPEYLLTETGRFVRTTFPPTIHVTTETAPGTGSIRGDATQLLQVLTNLATNARDSMPKGGSLHFKAQNVASDVVLSVTDTGCGIPEEAIAHIWEPFWTSKAAGFGTGLGLPTVKRIIEAHHGFVKVLTDTNGTSFHVHLPTAVPELKQADALPPEALHGGGRVVLLVDDQRSFLDLAAAILEDAGYRVIMALNGPEALHYFRGDQQIDVLVTDLSMSPMTGNELARNLRSVGLTLPIVYLSGFDAALPPDPTPQATLQKPVSREILLGTLARVLTRDGATTALPA